MRAVLLLLIAFLWPAATALRAEEPVLPAHLTDATGAVHEVKPGVITVLAWTAADCPMAKVYAPRLRALATDFAARGVQFFLVDSSSDRPAAGVASLITDPHGDLARRLGARSTTDVIVFGTDGRVAYRGALDDQYGYRRGEGLGAGTFRKEAARQEYLQDAITALLAGRAPAVSATDPMGCLLEWTAAEPPPSAPLAGGAAYYGGVEKILRAHCTDCHQPGGNAPFSLVSYEQARRRSRMLGEVVEERRMPPWSANPAYGHFANDPSLTAGEISTISGWLAAGLPAGDPAQALPPLPARPEWQIGAPDAVFETEPFTVPAEGQVPYRYVRIPTHLTEDRWVQATQILSTAPETVHHVLIFIENAAPPAPGAARPWTPRFDPLSLLQGVKPEERMKWVFRFMPYITKDMGVGGGGGLNGSFATTLAAGGGMVFPEGRAKLLPAGATVVMQIHYTPNGTAQESRTRLGLRFAKEPPTEPIDSRSVATVAFEIPPGDPGYQTTATTVLPRLATLLSLRPHMHVRGKAFRFVATFPDGREEVLLDVPKWDFEWQVEYVLAQPMALPKGTRLKAIATYDNSAANPANPDPAKTVYFGLQSHEEMMIGYYEVVWGPPAQTAALP